MPFATADVELVHVLHGRVWRCDLFSTGTVSEGTFKIGILTGALEVIIFNRKYSTTAPHATVGLYEAAFTGGVNPAVNNRRLSVTDSPPATVKSSVTASVSTVLFSANLRAGTTAGNAQGNFSEVADGVVLKPNTSYVVMMTNHSAGAADMDMLFDMRTTNPLYTFSLFGG